MVTFSKYLDRVESVINDQLGLLSSPYTLEGNGEKVRDAVIGMSSKIAELTTLLRKSEEDMDAGVYLAVDGLITTIGDALRGSARGVGFNYPAWKTAVEEKLGTLKEYETPDMRMVRDDALALKELNRSISELYAGIITKYSDNIKTDIGVPKPKEFGAVEMPFKVNVPAGESAADVQKFLEEQVRGRFPSDKYQTFVRFRGHPEGETGSPMCDVEISIIPKFGVEYGG
jgi:hypothetical protein